MAIGLVVAIVAAASFATTQVFAETPFVTNPESTLVTRIAEKFGLKKNDVQAVFDKERADRRAEIEVKYMNQLDQDVKAGKITEAQKKLIVSKRKELETKREEYMRSMQGKTKAEIVAAREVNRTTMEAERKSLEDWAAKNNIDIKYLKGGYMIFGGKGHGGGMMRGGKF